MEKDEIHIKLCCFCETDGGVLWDDSAYRKIEKIIVGCADNIVNSIQAVYTDFDGSIVLAPRHGGDCMASSYSSYFVITKPITRISGSSSADKNGDYGISFLEFSTSQGVCATFGKKNEKSLCFTFDSDTGFTGLHGQAEKGRLRTLGVYINTSANKGSLPLKYL